MLASVCTGRHILGGVSYRLAMVAHCVWKGVRLQGTAQAKWDGFGKLDVEFEVVWVCLYVCLGRSLGRELVRVCVHARPHGEVDSPCALPWTLE